MGSNASCCFSYDTILPATYHCNEADTQNPTKQPEHGRDPSQTTSERVQNQRNAEGAVGVRLVDADAGEVGEGVPQGGLGAVLRDRGAWVS